MCVAAGTGIALYLRQTLLPRLRWVLVRNLRGTGEYQGGHPLGHCAARLERSETDVHPVDCPFHWSKNRQTMGNSLWENTHKVLKFGSRTVHRFAQKRSDVFQEDRGTVMREVVVLLYVNRPDRYAGLRRQHTRTKGPKSNLTHCEKNKNGISSRKWLEPKWPRP